MINTFTLTAGQVVGFTEQGNFFRLLEAVDPITVRYYSGGSEVVSAETVKAGYAESFSGDGFDRVTITSATTQSIQFVTRQSSEVSYDLPPTGVVTLAGAVTLAGQQGAFTQTAATVTNVSASLAAAKSNRRYLLIQNKDSSGDIYVNLAGAAATTANGVKVEAGGALELQGYVPSAQIFAIGSIASNANIVIVEG